MDGQDALAYVRMRYADPRGDLGQVERQQEFMSAVAKRAMSPITWLLPVAGLRCGICGGRQPDRRQEHRHLRRCPAGGRDGHDLHGHGRRHNGAHGGRQLLRRWPGCCEVGHPQSTGVVQLDRLIEPLARSARSGKSGLMQTRTLGDTSVFPIGLGCMPMSGRRMLDHRDRAIETIHTALDAG